MYQHLVSKLIENASSFSENYLSTSWLVTGMGSVKSNFLFAWLMEETTVESCYASKYPVFFCYTVSKASNSASSDSFVILLAIEGEKWSIYRSSLMDSASSELSDSYYFFLVANFLCSISLSKYWSEHSEWDKRCSKPLEELRLELSSLLWDWFDWESDCCSDILCKFNYSTFSSF